MGPNRVASHLLVLFQATCMPRHGWLSLSARELLQHIDPPAAVSCPEAPPAWGGGCKKAGGCVCVSLEPTAGLQLLLLHGYISRALGWLLPGSVMAHSC